MLEKIGVEHVDALFDAIPKGLHGSSFDALPEGKSESCVADTLRQWAKKNHTCNDGPFFLGAGAYAHHVPAVVDHIIQRSEFLTSYTPYQPEVAQGTLQMLFEFQTQVCLITGMEVANASMYDGSTACGEAMLMATRITKKNKVIVSGALHPHYANVLQTLEKFTPVTLQQSPPNARGEENLEELITEETACVIVQNPGFFGNIIDTSALAKKAHAHKALLIVVFTEALAMGAIKSPGDMGADIVVGEGQSLGNALNFGGPYVGLFATKQKYLRQMPGRLCGQTTDSEGNPAFVLTLAAREQHIRREKARSNICTNSGLCCLAFSAHLALLGEQGYRRLALLNHKNAVALAETLESIPDVTVVTPAFFNEMTVKLPVSASPVVEKLSQQGIMAGVPVARLLPDHGMEPYLITTASELNMPHHREAFATALKDILS